MTDLYAFTKPGDPDKSIIDLQCASVFQIGLAGADNERAVRSRCAIRSQSRHGRRCSCRSRLQRAVRIFPRRKANRDSSPSSGRASGWRRRRRRCCRPGSTRLSRARSPGDGSRRLPYVLRLAQRSVFLRRHGLISTTCSSRATTSSKTKMCAASCLKCRTRNWEAMTVGMWARTLDKTGEGWIQADRGGRPLQAVFLVGEEREAYLSGEPANDDRFIGVFAHELEHRAAIRGRTQWPSREQLLPDILSYDPREPVSVSAEWPNTDRRCCRRVLIYAHERKGDRR